MMMCPDIDFHPNLYILVDSYIFYDEEIFVASFLGDGTPIHREDQRLLCKFGYRC